MASHPDAHPDSTPGGPADDPERVSSVGEPGRESVEEPSPMEDPGSAGGTSGTGGTNHRADRDITS